MGTRKPLTARLYGPPPPPGASRAQTLRWIRRTSSWGPPVTVLMLVLTLIFSRSTWLTVVLAVCAAVSIANFVVLSVRIQRLERAESGDRR
jgi:hypothetical protein